ncbi:MAG TPA: OB-fold nucleic acid binding domain-containing protein, partial [Savagea sp.]
KSRWNHTVEGQNIRLGFKQVKGLPRTFYSVWKEVRRDETIRTIYDVARLLKKAFTEPLALDLIYSGACDELEGSRSTNINRIPAALGIAQFGDAGSIKEIKGETKDPLTLLEEEYARLQLYISEHPLERMRQTYTETIPLATIEEQMNYVKVLAFIRTIRTTRTKNGEAMAFVTIEDETATMTAIFFPKSYKRFAEQLQERAVLQLEGKMQFRRGEKELIVNKCEQVSQL